MDDRAPPRLTPARARLLREALDGLCGAVDVRARLASVGRAPGGDGGEREGHAILVGFGPTGRTVTLEHDTIGNLTAFSMPPIATEPSR